MPDYRRLARRAAEHYGLDPDVFERQIDQESGFRTDAVSPAGARGIAQFMPDTARQLGVNPDDPGAALDGAARWMGELLKKYGGDYAKALAAYNAGPGNVDKYGGIPPFEETQRYVRTILGAANPLAATTAEAAGPGPEPTDETDTMVQYGHIPEGGTVDPSTPHGPPAPVTPQNPAPNPSLAEVYRNQLQSVDALIATAEAQAAVIEAKDGQDGHDYRTQAEDRQLSSLRSRLAQLNDRRGSLAVNLAKLGQTAPARPLNAPTNRPYIVRMGADGKPETVPNPNYTPPAAPGTRNGGVLGNAAGTTEKYIVRQRPDGSWEQIANPNYVPPKPEHFQHDGGLYSIDADGNIKQIMGPPQDLTVVSTDPSRPSVVLKDRNGNLVAARNPAFDPQQQQLDLDKQRQALMGEQQKHLQDMLATVNDLQQQLQDGKIDQGQADQYADLARRNLDAQLLGTTPWQQEQERQRRQEAQQTLAQRTLAERLQAGQAAASGFAGNVLNAKLLPKPGGYHVDPGQFAQGVVDRFSPPGVGNWAANTLVGPDQTAALTPPIGSPGGLPTLGTDGMTPWVAAGAGMAAGTPGANGRMPFGASMAQAAQPAATPTNGPMTPAQGFAAILAQSAQNAGPVLNTLNAPSVPPDATTQWPVPAAV